MEQWPRGFRGGGSEKYGGQVGRYKRDLGVLAEEAMVCPPSRKSFARASISKHYAPWNKPDPKHANPLTVRHSS